MAARAGTTPIFADSPPDEFRGGWEFAALDEDQAAARPVPVRQVVRTPYWHWIILILLTLAGGALRFAWLERPAIWGDEAATYWRIMGSYEELLEMLSRTRFMPLHYQAMWAVANPGDALLLLKGDVAGFVREQAIDPGQQRMTPRMMRLIPAICGTLMIPAMYFLARQLLSRRAALLTAAFTACSAYVFVYSRDAKMYMPFFLALALNMGCFLWWMRTRCSLGWLGWVASGLATLGLHMSGLGVIALQPVYLLTQRRPHWVQAVLFVLGLGLIFSGPLGYYQYFNRFGEKIEERGWQSTGIGWVEVRNRGHGPVELTFDSIAAYLYAWNFVPESSVVRMTPGRVTTAIVIMAVFLGCCAIGALPWAMKLRGDSPRDPPAEAWWRNVLWLGLWIIVPIYGVYCLSFPKEPMAGLAKPPVVSPMNWLTGLGTWLTGPWRPSDSGSVAAAGMQSILQMRAFLLVSGIVLLGALMLLWRMIPRALAAIVGFTITVLGLILLVSESGFQPLYDAQSPAEVRLRDGIYLFLLIAVPPLLWYFAGRSLWQRTRKALILLALIGALWGACYATYLSVKPADGSVWMPRYLAFIWPATALALCGLIVRLPTRPLRWGAIALVLGVNLAQVYGRVFIGNEPPVDRIVADILSDTREAETLTFTPMPRTHRQDPRLNIHNFGTPGGGHFTGMDGRYYFAHQIDEPVPAITFGGWNVQRHFRMRTNASPEQIRNAVAREPQARRVIVWEQYPDEATARTADDPILAALGDGWRLVDEQIHNVRFYWSWADLYTHCRREYVKQEPEPAGDEAAASS